MTRVGLMTSPPVVVMPQIHWFVGLARALHPSSTCARS